MTNKQRMHSAIFFFCLALIDFFVLKKIPLGVITTIVAVYFFLIAKYNSEK
mgnify:CR=1 FL=1